MPTIGTERERRWLFSTWPKSLHPERVRQLTQGVEYFDRRRNVVRRLRLDHSDPQRPVYELTEKSGRGGVRDETTTTLTAEEFAGHWEQVIGRPYRKDRHCLPFGRLVAEADVFADHLSGLRMVEVEFERDEDARNFQPLFWFGPEVTEDDRFSNARLGVDGLPLVFKLWQHFGQPPQWPTATVERGLPPTAFYLERHLSGANRPTIIGVAGGSASGKTTRVAAAVQQAFGGRAVILSMDDYFRGKSYLAAANAEGRHLTWDQPEAVDLELLSEHLYQLLEGRTIRKPVYSFTAGERLSEEDFAPAPLIIVEGLFVFHQPVLPLLDLRVFVAVGAHSQIIRRMLRDPDRTGQSPSAVSRYLAEVVMPMHDRFVETTRPLADLVFTNDYQPDLEASRAGFNAVQLKFPGWVEEHQLRRQRAELVMSTQQDDDYLQPGQPFQSEIFRIRREGGRFTLAYKGPPSAAWRQRATLHFAIDEETATALQRVYHTRLRQVSKSRMLYALPGLLVAQDEVTITANAAVRQLGRITELRFLNPEVSPEQIAEAVMSLGLSMADCITESYAVL